MRGAVVLVDAVLADPVFVVEGFLVDWASAGAAATTRVRNAARIIW
jgi:hypothetical protein